ncbi:hypothetical protein BR93DRAFT_705343 [Coniochaeta sp. PMI_546]|nr:hypothetical protein BR93DRAFT_705343 [Coniochaeta sp. PMI_546]
MDQPRQKTASPKWRSRCSGTGTDSRIHFRRPLLSLFFISLFFFCSGISVLGIGCVGLTIGLETRFQCLDWYEKGGVDQGVSGDPDTDELAAG